jgi:spermidine synthase
MLRTFGGVSETGPGPTFPTGKGSPMIELTVFLCGAVVMVLEMTGSRILAPYLGTSIIVWTSLIGIILASLSLGYWWGGRKADRSPTSRGMSLIVLSAAFFIAAIAVTKTFVLDFVQQNLGSIHLGSAIATLVLFAPPSVLLGMVSPYAVKLKLRDMDTSGSTVGRLYAVSTAGSILGTFLGGFVLIAFFGSTGILYVLALALVMASLCASFSGKRMKLASGALFVLLFLASASYARYQKSLGFHDIDTDYSRIVIYDGRDVMRGRMVRAIMTHPKAMQSAMFVDDPGELFLEYTKFFELAFYFKPELKKMLMLGGGGYSFPKYSLKEYPGTEIGVVEIDPMVTGLAKRYFALDEDPRLTVFHRDARNFLNSAGRRYEAIVGDVFNSHYSLPFHLATREAVESLRNTLTDDGVAVMNVLGQIEGRNGAFVRALYATFKSVFPQVWLFPVSDPEDGSLYQNIILVALKSGEKPDFSKANAHFGNYLAHLWTRPVDADYPVLTDDYAPVENYLNPLF